MIGSDGAGNGLLNDGSADAPKLRVYLNLDTLKGLRADTVWCGETGKAQDVRLRADGFEGVQLTTLDAYDGALPYCGLDRVNVPAEADAVAARHAQRGDACITVHAGWGMEDDDAVSRLVEAILNASERHQLPIFIETHRATITQDVWRTVEIARRFPEARFNVDLSHYYCGQELVYGDWTEKLAFMEPIFARVGFMHGRIASPGCMQVPMDVAREGDAVDHFKEMWTRAMRGFLRRAVTGDVLIFAPELLCAEIYYARTFPDPGGKRVEESDRYADAVQYQDLARECFHAAQTLNAGLQAG